jgi:hypothetical protein
LDNTLCPLCVRVVSLVDLTLHLATSHGVVPQSAVNALLLWVLTTNNFVNNNNSNNDKLSNNNKEGMMKFNKSSPSPGKCSQKLKYLLNLQFLCLKGCWIIS